MSTETPVVPGGFESADDLRARGRELAERFPTTAQADDLVAADRPSVVDYLRTTHEQRLPELLGLRVARMLESPYAFLRGSAGLMAADLAGGPTSTLTAQLCGDAHAGNFGLYGTSDGDVVIDINDFDETVVGPWEWDLRRLATSLVLAGRASGVSEDKVYDAAQDAAKQYRRTVRRLAELPFLRSWTALADEGALSRTKADDLTEDFEKAVDKARRNTSDRVVAKSVEHIDDHETGVRRHRFVDDPPVLFHLPDRTVEAIERGVQDYVPTLRESRQPLLARYRIADAAFRVVGTGSVGMRSYVVLLHGNSGEDLVLQVKQAGPSALAPYVDQPPVEHEARRVVEGARQVQADTDILLGWTSVEGRPFVVRQFRNMKGGLDPTELAGGMLDDYGRLCGALLARAHSRSLHPLLLAAYFEGDTDLDEAVGDYAIGYADQTERDHAELKRAVDSGELPAEID